MFQDQLRGVFAIDNLWLLGGLWIVLKAFHECWHGLVCRKYGGAVPEAGVSLLLLVTPLGYVDATSSTAFPSKWARMSVAGAGIYGELLLAAVAALVWARIEPGLLSSALHQVIVISSVTTILFNANPLMRFDGYYMLSDSLDIPNLAKRGQQMFSWLFRRWVLGVRGATFPLAKGEQAWVISIYGILAALWRVAVICGLLVAAAHLFRGIGLALAIIVGLAILATNVQRWWKYLRDGARADGASSWRILARLVLISALPITLLSFVQIHPASKAAAVVRSSAGGEVRVSCPGFLTEIVVSPGSWVEAGEVVMRLDNPEQTAAYRQAEIEVERSRLKIDDFRARGEIASLKAEQRNLRALEQKVSELRDWIQSLELRAPRSGQVIGDSLAALRGNWMGRGQNLFTIGNPNSSEILILLPQDEIAAVGESLEKGSAIRFQSTGRPGSWGATIVGVTPSAVVESPHFALTVPGGGPLDVRRDQSDRGDSYMLLKPHVEVHAQIDRANDVRMLDGETAGPDCSAATETNSWSISGLAAWRGQPDSAEDGNVGGFPYPQSVIATDLGLLYPVNSHGNWIRKGR